jgi:hypothetical protein
LAPGCAGAGGFVAAMSGMRFVNAENCCVAKSRTAETLCSIVDA